MTKHEITLCEALSLAAAECPPIAHDKENTYSRYTYATLAQIREAVVPVLAKHKISIVLIEALERDNSIMFKFIVAVPGFAELELLRSKPIPKNSKTPEDKLVAGMVTTAWREIYADLLHLRMGVEDGDARDDHRDEPRPKRQQQQQQQDSGWSEDRFAREREQNRRNLERENKKIARDNELSALEQQAEALFKQLPPEWKERRNSTGLDMLAAAKANGKVGDFVPWAKKVIDDWHERQEIDATAKADAEPDSQDLF
jgi:hypothetical protein